jgi:hypothetical protein
MGQVGLPPSDSLFNAGSFGELDKVNQKKEAKS